MVCDFGTFGVRAVKEILFSPELVVCRCIIAIFKFEIFALNRVA